MRVQVLLITVLLGSQGVSQGFLLSRTSGSQVAGKPVALRGAGADRELVWQTAEQELQVPIASILALQGPAPEVTSPVAVYLNGGGELKGSVQTGDDVGEHFVLVSPSLGSATVPVDRLRTLVFREQAASFGYEDFAIDENEEYSEALFRRADRGFDIIGGELERFLPEGISFAPSGRRFPTVFLYDKLTGMTIRGGVESKTEGDWLLITVTGDRIRVELTDVTATAWLFACEFGAISLAPTQVSALTRIAGERRFLSDMEPVRVVETGSESGAGAANHEVGRPLFTYRRDRTVTGGILAEERSRADGFLVVDGYTYGKGLGVHSRCFLTYRVPPGMGHFHAKVAIDDEVKSLGVRGDVDVRVRMGDEVLFEKKGLRRGQAPHTLKRLKVQAGALLTLEVDFGKGLFLGDRVDWLTAVFMR